MLRRVVVRMPADLPSPPGTQPAVDPPAADRLGIPVPAAGPRGDALTVLAIGVTVVIALYVGQTLLVPLALGGLLSFALAPLVGRFQRWRMGRVPSVLLAVVMALALLVGVGAIVANQVIALAEDLPLYEQNIRQKIRDVRSSTAGEGLVERTTRVIEDIGEELEEEEKTKATPAPENPRAPIFDRPAPEDDPEVKPVPVRIEPGPASTIDMLRELLGPVLAPVATAGLVLVFVVFMLLQRHDLRDRLISLAGTHDMRKATEALDEAGQRVSRYLLTHLVLNLLYGIPIGVGLWLIGVPNAALWGMLATVLRFIPFLGPVIAAFFPIMLSVAVDPGWTLPLMTIALVVAVELFSNNVLEPWLYGSSTGLSPFAVVLAAIFWTALWGPVGLLLATPLTVCLVVLGKHVPQLGFLEVLLGNQPALPAPARIYQRLLARAPDEAALIAEEMSAAEDGVAGTPEEPGEAKNAAWVYDELVLPALRLADQDRAAGNLSRADQSVLLHGVEAMVDFILEAREEPPPDYSAASGRVLCIAARSTLDEAVGLLLVDLLHDRGLAAEVLPCEAVGVRALPHLRRDGVRAIVLSYLDGGDGPHPARLVRRLKRYFGPQVPVLVGDWAGPVEAGGKAPIGDVGEVPVKRDIVGADGTVRSLADAVKETVALVDARVPA